MQIYEQRNKDINKASVETIHSLAKVLGCTIEDRIGKQAIDIYTIIQNRFFAKTVF